MEAAMWEEFKKFAMRGNVIDLGRRRHHRRGVRRRSSTSLVSDIIMPIVGAVTGGLDFSNYYTPLSSKVDASACLCGRQEAGCRARLGPVSDCRHQLFDHRLGLFIAIKGINKLKREEPAAAPAEPTAEVKLLTEIRDLLRQVARYAAPSRANRHFDLPCDRITHLTMETENEAILPRGPVLPSLNLSTAFAQETCESKAISKEGRPLAGAAKTSFFKKCKRDSCQAKAVGSNGRPLAGAAKKSFMQKCEREA
jgi:large conductance mechanosensitive channel